MKTQILKYALAIALFATGTLALMEAVGDADPNSPMSLEGEMATRAAMLCIAGGCIKAGQWCGKKGLLPDELYENKNKEDKED